ncbi:unnamed protein product [Closterium sp. NIES-54]
MLQRSDAIGLVVIDEEDSTRHRMFKCFRSTLSSAVPSHTFSLFRCHPPMLQRSDAIGLVVIDEEDNATLLVHRISADDIYQRQEGKARVCGGTIAQWHVTRCGPITCCCSCTAVAGDLHLIMTFTCSKEGGGGGGGGGVHHSLLLVHR